MTTKNSTRPPLVAWWIMKLLAPDYQRDEMLDAFGEDYVRKLETGKRTAQLWAYSQAIRSFYHIAKFHLCLWLVHSGMVMIARLVGL